MMFSKTRVVALGLAGVIAIGGLGAWGSIDRPSEPVVTVEAGTPTAGINAAIEKAFLKASKEKVHVSKKAIDKVKAGKDTEDAQEAVDLKEYEEKTGYVAATTLNVRDTPNKKGEVVKTLIFNEKVRYCATEFEDWVAIGDDQYVCSEYITDQKCEYKTIKATWNTRKSFESKNVFGKKTRQQLLQNCAYTNGKGFRIVDGRYCIAVGSAVGDLVGTYIDVVLENGTVIPCVMGDQKAARDTDPTCQRTANGCVSEFIVDVNALVRNCPKAANMGDVSYAFPEWQSRVVEFRVYEKNALD